MSDEKGAYRYDAFNRMEEFTGADGSKQTNRYDAEGLRHEMEENGQLVQFLYSGREVVAETESNGNVIRYIRGLGLISSDSESAKTYYHYVTDEYSSVTHVIEGEEKAVDRATAEITALARDKKQSRILNHYTYDAFGNTISCEEEVPNRFRYNGEQYDPVTQQYYLRARYYNPVISRFTQEDTYYGDGLNLYRYCANNPVRYKDPSGHGSVEQNPYNRHQGEVPAGYFQDANGIWRRPNGQFASNAEVGLSKPNSNSTTNQGGRSTNSSGGNKHQGNINANMSDILNRHGLNRIEDVWRLPGTERGKVIEELLACSEYSDWWNCGAENGGFFEVVDFQNGLDVVSLKSIDPTLPTYQNGKGTEKIISYIDDLNRGITVDGMPANRILDVRIPKGTTNCLNLEQILNYANRRGITVSIKEF